MRSFLATAAWTFVLGLSALAAGGSLFGLLGFALSDPGRRPATWAGWDLLFYGLVVGPPLVTCAITITLGVLHRLPGTRLDARPADSSSATPDPDPWKS